MNKVGIHVSDSTGPSAAPGPTTSVFVGDESGDQANTKVTPDVVVSSTDLAHRRYKVGQTVALVALWISMGIYSSLISICLPDLRDRLQTSTQAMALAVGAKRIGSMVGGLGGGIAHDRFHTKSNAFLAVAITVAGTSIMIQPWTTYVEALGTAVFIEGLAQGTIDAVGNSFVTSVWGESSGPAMHAIHFGFTLGSIVTPQMAAPFLSPDIVQLECDVTNTSTTWCPTESTTVSNDNSQNSRIEIPYFIAGGIAVAMSAVFWTLFARGPPKAFTTAIKTKTSMKEVFNPSSCGGGKLGFGVIMVTLMVLWAICSQGTLGAFNFYFTFAIESDLGFTKQEGTWFDFTMKCAGMVGRLLGIVISHFCPIQAMLMVEVIIMLVSTTLTATVGVYSKLPFWIFCALTQMMGASAWPGLYAFMDKYIILFSFIVALSMIGGGGAAFIVSWAVGYLFDNVSKSSIFYLSAGSCGALLIVQIVMQIVASHYGPRARGGNIQPNEESGIGVDNGGYEDTELN